jgi:lysozyme
MDVFDQLVRPAEGSRLKVYDDDATGLPIIPGSVVRGHPTIGIGRALDTQGISPVEQDYLYHKSKQAAIEGVADKLPWVNSLFAVRQSLVYAMAYQMGIAGLLQFHHSLAAIQSGNWIAAHDGMLASEWAKQTPASQEDGRDHLLRRPERAERRLIREMYGFRTI